MKRWNCILAFAFAAYWLSAAQAGKPDKSGGGKGDTASSSPTMIVLDTGAGYANGINQQGEIVGYLVDANGDIPCHWTISESGAVTVTELPLGNLNGGRANDINQAGMIVGEGQFWLDKTRDPVSLPVPSGTGRVRAEAINDRGIIVGSYEDPDGNDHAAAWAVRTDGTLSNPLDLGAGYAICWDVNNSDVAVGERNEIAMRWQLALVGQSLALNSEQPLFTSSSAAKGINDSGDICGTVQAGGSNAQAFLLMHLEEGLVKVPLPEQDSGRQDTQNKDAFALNNAIVPQILGKRDVLDLRGDGYREWDVPVLWQGDQAINLEQSIPFFLSAEAINDSGWMVGRGYDLDGMLFPIVVVP